MEVSTHPLARLDAVFVQHLGIGLKLTISIYTATTSVQ